MYYLIQHAPIRWPDKQKHGIEVSEEAKDLISNVNKNELLFSCCKKIERKDLARKMMRMKS